MPLQNSCTAQQIQSYLAIQSFASGRLQSLHQLQRLQAVLSKQTNIILRAVHFFLEQILVCQRKLTEKAAASRDILFTHWAFSCTLHTECGG